jgi:hypothetical protein
MLEAENAEKDQELEAERKRNAQLQKENVGEISESMCVFQ